MGAGTRDLMRPLDRDIKIFPGTASSDLAKSICNYLDLPVGRADLYSFSDGERYCQIMENVRGSDVFVIQSTCTPVNDHLMELLVMLDAFKRSSASRITAVIPYYGYARQDRKDKPRVPITAKLVADLLEAAGADRIVALDLHAPAIQGFFSIPVDHLFAAPVFIASVERMGIEDLTIVSPDAGGVERARAYAKRLKATLAIVDKRRGEGNVPQVMHLIGEVKGRNTLIVDDIVDSATTVLECAKALKKEGAKSVYGCFSHAVLSAGAGDKLKASDLTRTLVTDSIPLEKEKRTESRIEVLSVAELLGEAIFRIHNNSSVSSLFI
jgi:ribose-phosphate pyrophosphokinase